MIDVPLVWRLVVLAVALGTLPAVVLVGRLTEWWAGSSPAAVLLRSHWCGRRAQPGRVARRSKQTPAGHHRHDLAGPSTRYVRRAAKIQGTIDAEAFYDYVLAHAPELVRGRQEADEATASGELGKSLTEVAADLEAEERGTDESGLRYLVSSRWFMPAVVPYLL